MLFLILKNTKQYVRRITTRGITTQGITNSVKTRLKKAGFTLPIPGSPKGSYVQTLRVGNLLYTSGHISTNIDGSFITGKITTIDKGQKAAESVGLSLLATVNNALDGDLDNISKVVKLTGFVNCHDDFIDHPSVLNGCSDLMTTVFGSVVGKHVRSAVGVSSLPLDVSVEIEAIFEVKL